MRAIRLILLVVVGLFLVYQRYTAVPKSGESGLYPSSIHSDTHLNGAVPKKVLQVLDIIRETGRPPEGYVGGTVFQNREGQLPADGDYREFDVDPHEGGRNAERIVMEWQTKKAWYTSDHYQTFTQLP